ncbi:hypothetical protein PG991_001776 [Apiospora marii]|uniref:F-box domain-containing protein n=1 Tax=Apiospora marii TaxID=335849 RepID=A0ABR1SQD2_9PEZI
MPWLPAEVWYLIRGLLEDDKRTLSRLCRTCKSLREFAEPALYARYSIFIGPQDHVARARRFAAFYRTVLDTPRLAARVVFLQLIIAVPTDEAGRRSAADEIAALLRRTVAERFRFGYGVDRVVKREWGVVPLAALLPFLLPNLEHFQNFEARHYPALRLVRCLHRGGRLPSLKKLTHMVLNPDTFDPRGSCGRPDAFRLGSVAPLMELAPNLQDLTFYSCQGHEPTNSRRRRRRLSTTDDTTHQEEGEGEVSFPPLLPKFPASLQSLHLKYGHFNAAELTHALSDCRRLRRFAYSEEGPNMFKPASGVLNYHDITPGQVIEALRPVARDTLERLELSLWCAPRLRNVGTPRLIRGNLGGAFPNLAEVSLSAEDLFWTLGPKPTTALDTDGRLLLDLLPEPTLRVLEFPEFDAPLVPDLRRLAEAVACEGRFPRLRAVRVNVAPEDPGRVEEYMRRFLPELETLEPKQRAGLAGLFGRGGVVVELGPHWMWGDGEDK